MGDVMSDTNWVRSDDWVGTEIDGSFVMVSVESGKYVALNETAHAIWTALERRRTIPRSRTIWANGSMSAVRRAMMSRCATRWKRCRRWA